MISPLHRHTKEIWASLHFRPCALMQGRKWLPLTEGGGAIDPPSLSPSYLQPRKLMEQTLIFNHIKLIY